MKDLKMSPAEREEMLLSVCTHAGFYVLLEEMDTIINRIRDGIHGCKLSNDPIKDGLALLEQRQKLDGAIALKNALIVRVNKCKAEGESR